MLKIFLRFTIFLATIFRINSVLAVGNTGLDTAATQAGLKTSTDIPSSIGRILGSVIGFTGTIFFVLVVYAGLKWMTAAGNEESVAKAKKILTAAVIGLIIVMSAYAITKFIGTVL